MAIVNAVMPIAAHAQIIATRPAQTAQIAPVYSVMLGQAPINVGHVAP
jgi:hypothetical protein